MRAPLRSISARVMNVPATVPRRRVELVEPVRLDRGVGDGDGRQRLRRRRQRERGAVRLAGLEHRGEARRLEPEPTHVEHDRARRETGDAELAAVAGDRVHLVGFGAA